MEFGSRGCFVLGSLLCGLLVSFLLGFLASFVLTSLPSLHKVWRLTSDNSRLRPDVTHTLLSRIDRQSLRVYLTWLARDPHPVGSERDVSIEDWIRRTLLNLRSFNHVGLDTSNVLLSLPPTTQTGEMSNGVEVIDSDNRVSRVMQCPSPTACYAAFSIDTELMGTSMNNEAVEGDVVFVNYGTKEDLKYIKESDGLSLSGKIALAKISASVEPGEVALRVQGQGARALLLFHDVQDTASLYRPNVDESEVMRVSVHRVRGDISTPGFPSIPGLMSRVVDFRVEKTLREEKKLQHVANFLLPSIPVQPISPLDARRLLAALGGRRAPIAWMDSYNNVANLGGTFLPGSGMSRLRVRTHNRLKKSDISNVIGVIRGEVEPDRYVILGAPRDAFLNGALHPSSGIAAVVKVAEALDFTIRKTGWRPRRSIVFASWAASKLGNIGSTEFVEKNEELIKFRAVAYINADLCSGGAHLASSVSGSLRPALMAALKAVPFNPDADDADDADDDLTYFDFYSKHQSRSSSGYYYSGSLQNSRKSEDGFDDLLMDGDEASFASRTGLASMSVRFNFNESSYFVNKDSEGDTMENYERHVDPDYRLLQLCTRVLAHVVRNVSDQLWLPFEPHYLVHQMRLGLRELKRSILDLQQEEDEQQTRENLEHLDLSSLEKAINHFDVVSANLTRFMATMRSVLEEDAMSVRMLNDVIMQTERMLVLTNFPMHNGSHHGILYGSKVFSGAHRLVDALLPRDDDNDEELQRRRRSLWNQLRMHIDQLVIALVKAANHMKDFHILT